MRLDCHCTMSPTIRVSSLIRCREGWRHTGQNAVVDYFLRTLDKHAVVLWLKAGKGVLKAAERPKTGKPLIERSEIVRGPRRLGEVGWDGYGD